MENKSFAKTIRNELAARHKNTDEVKDVLTGAGFKKVRPSYSSRPDTRKTEVQHQVLSQKPGQFSDYEKLYGKKQNLRHLQPKMDVILAWGEFDPPVKNDFTTNNKAFEEKNKINKMGVEFITEKQDNFRNPANIKGMSKVDQIIEYLKEENQSLIRQKIHKNIIDKEHMAQFSTEYRDQTMKHDFKKSQTSKDLHEFYENVTVAGKARYLSKDQSNGQPIVTPEEFIKNQLQEKIKGVWHNIAIDPRLERDNGQSLNDNDLDATRHQQSLISANTSSSPNKKAVSAEAQRILDQQMRELNDEQREELAKKLKDLKLSSRWLPDSAMTTYFGKPAFHAYGNGNTNPTYGGSVYGQYMKTFNINPHAGGNKPEYSQVHGRTLLGGTVQVRAPGSRSPKKKPIKMVRKPIPPRIAPNKKQVPEAELLEDLKNRLPTKPQTWKQASAKELEILPPTFTEKHLQTKKQAEVKQLIVGRQKKQPSEARILPQKVQPDIQVMRNSDRSANISEHNTLDSNRMESGKRSFPIDPSAQDLSVQQPERAPQKQSKDIPFCEVHGGMETTAMEFLHLLDPKNYKFLPSQFTNQIRPAGRITAKSENVSNLLNLEA